MSENSPLYWCVCVRYTEREREWLAFQLGEEPVESRAVHQPLSPDEISPLRPEQQSLTTSNNSEPVCSRGMLYLSSPEDAGCGTDKDLHVSACLFHPSVALETGGGGEIPCKRH